MPEPTVATSERVEVTYQKSNFFRVIHADGCYGGFSPRGQMHISFYSERFPIPRRTEFYIVDGIAGVETVLETKAGVLREVESDVIMDFNSAIGFFVWFREKLEQTRSQIGIPDAEWQRLTGGRK